MAELVRSVPHDEAMLAAAWLHDVVEDVAPTRPQFGLPAIREHFGLDVADLVGWLTDASTPVDGNRAARKALDRAHSAAAPARAQTIKVADLIDNSRTILVRDRGFARVYVPEKEALLDVLVLADAGLRRMALEQLAEFTGDGALMPQEQALKLVWSRPRRLICGGDGPAKIDHPDGVIVCAGVEVVGDHPVVVCGRYFWPGHIFDGRKIKPLR